MSEARGTTLIRSNIPAVYVVRRGQHVLGRLVMMTGQPAVTPDPVSIGCTFQIHTDLTLWWNNWWPKWERWH